MAIVPMNKIFLAGMKADQKALMEHLMNAGVVQIEEFSSEETEAYRECAEPASVVSELNQAEDRLFRAQTAIASLSAYDVRKKGLFAGKTAVARRVYKETVEQGAEIEKIISTICSYEDAMEELRAESNHLEHKKEQLRQFAALDIPLETDGTKYTTALAGAIPALFDVREIRKRMEDEGFAAELTALSSDEINHNVFIVCLDEELERFTHFLEEYGFSRNRFEGVTGTAAANISALERRQAELAAREEHIKKDLLTMAEYLPKLELYYDHLCAERDKISAGAALLETQSSFFLRGWLPVKSCDTLQKFLLEHYEQIVVEITEPEADEEYPVLLHNNKFAESFEMITELYSLPNSHEVDPNPTMSVFYMMFFGLMLSDAGYGLILSLLTGFILWRYKPEGMMNKMMRLLFLGGLSTIFWGVLFGGWFGDLFSGIYFTSLPAVQPVWFSPLTDPMTLLLWSFVFGAVHLFTGMAVKAYMLIKDGHWLDAVFDIGFWYVFLIGLVLLFVGGPVGKIMAIGGAAGLILTQGRGEKNFFMRIGKGIFSLYDVTGYLSDILSYSRLLALGLATGVIAQVVNTMGKLTGTSVIGIIFFVIILLVGHTFNLAINTLGAYVHSSRLQYVEYFGKFYTGGGQAFCPLTRKTKYITMK